MDNDEKWLTQYEMYLEIYHEKDKLIWTVPTISIAITTGIFSASNYFIIDSLMQGLLYLLGGLLIVGQVLRIYKARVFQSRILKDMKEIEGSIDLLNLSEKLQTTKENNGPGPSDNPDFITSLKDYTAKILNKISAGNYLLYCTFFQSLILIGLSVYNFCLYFGPFFWSFLIRAYNFLK